MKTKLLTAVLTVTALAILALTWALRPPKPPATDAVPAPVESGSVPAPPGPAAKAPVGAVSPAPASPPAVLKWEDIESPDYTRYVSGLRAAGFPEELIRTIIRADVDKLFEPREAALKPKTIPFDAPMSQRSPQEMTNEDWDKVRQLRDVRMEKQALLQKVLGVYVPREILQSPNSRRNYDAYEYALSQLPPEKREAAQLAQENEILTEGIYKATIHDSTELEAFKRSCAERDVALHQALTPEEFDRYERNTTSSGTELARRTIGMEPTEAEFATMFRIAWKDWVDCGGVYGRWRAEPVSREQIVAADQEMEVSMRQALGPDRYLDYQMAISETGQQMRNLAARFDLPRDTVAQAFALQTEADQLARGARVAIAAVNADGSNPAPAQSPVQRLTEVQGQLEQVLGPEVWQAWQDGRRRQVSLDP